MDSSLINKFTSSEAIPTLPLTTDPSTSIGPEATSEVLARLERQISELNHIVIQTREALQTPPNTTPLLD
ncbi:hypothetical protein HAX54_036636, partial [Datura stramonium]|nr:hypothetical protein [Datura stramonium]